MPHYHKTISKRRMCKMNARQHKKFYLGNFQILGFSVSGNLLPEYRNPIDFDIFLDETIAFVESCNIFAYGGGSPDDFSFIFENQKRSEPFSEQKRRLLLDWLSAHNKIGRLSAGKLIDTVYSSEKAFEIRETICK